MDLSDCDSGAFCICFSNWLYQVVTRRTGFKTPHFQNKFVYIYYYIYIFFVTKGFVSQICKTVRFFVLYHLIIFIIIFLKIVRLL